MKPNIMEQTLHIDNFMFQCGFFCYELLCVKYIYCKLYKIFVELEKVVLISI